MSGIRIPARVSNIALAQFDVLNSRAAQLRAGGHHVISLGQALPGFGPPASAIVAAQEALATTEAHIYSADAGLSGLREALCERLPGVRPDEVIITAGGNQAFMLALMTLVDPGDEVLLPAPYFVNHEMAIAALGAVPKEIPLDEARGFGVRWADLEPHVTSRTRAVVICSPSNPTGAVIGGEEMARIVSELAKRNVVLFSDETYARFVYEDVERGAGRATNGPSNAAIPANAATRATLANAATPVTLARPSVPLPPAPPGGSTDVGRGNPATGPARSAAGISGDGPDVERHTFSAPSALDVPGWRDNVVVLSTFSKAFGMTGWRVGYMVADAGVCAQAIKVQDAMIICAPVVSQMGVEAAVRASWDYPLAFRDGLIARRRLLIDGLSRIPRLHWTPTGGGFFAFVRVAGCTDSARLANDLLERAHVVTIPGSTFGRCGEGFIRLSYGAVSRPDLQDAIARLATFFGPPL